MDRSEHDRQAAALEPLMQQALRVRLHAHAPYSRFLVGAAVATKDGRVFLGCNVENASYGITNCAERTALFSAIAAGCRAGDFVALAVVGDTPGPIAPCGACRQVIHELCDATMPVLMGNLGDARVLTTPDDLLPGAFVLDPSRG